MPIFEILTDSQPTAKKSSKNYGSGHFLLQACTHARSSPHRVSFHVRGGAKNKNHFQGHSGGKNLIFGVKNMIFQFFTYLVSLDDTLSEYTKFNFI